MKRVCGSQHVGESLSSSQHSTARRKIVNRESEVDVCLFVKGDQHQFKTSSVLKLEPFINAGLGLVLKYVYHDCIAFEGKACVNGFVS